jgi:hypothetical protein
MDLQLDVFLAVQVEVHPHGLIPPGQRFQRLFLPLGARLARAEPKAGIFTHRFKSSITLLLI